MSDTQILVPEQTLRDLTKAITKLTTRVNAMSNGTKPKIPKRRETGEFVKDPLNYEEQMRVLNAAEHYFEHRDSTSRPGAQSKIGGERLKQTMYMMFHCGMHRRVLHDPIGKLLKYDADNHKARWRRPKKTGSKAETNVPILTKDRDWVPDWIAWIRVRGGINSMLLNRIMWQIGRDARLPQAFSPLTARHTCGVNMHRAGLDMMKIQEILNCSSEVAKRYCTYEEEDALENRGYQGPGLAPLKVGANGTA